MTSRIERMELTVGGLTRANLLGALEASGVGLNAHAETLLHREEFDGRDREAVVVTERTVAGLGFPDGATLPEIFRGARDQDLLLCPLATAPYLRLAWDEQASAPDSVMSAGRAPTDSLTVASEVPSADHEFPKGFYLRRVDGEQWLRGYRCDDEHVWAADDRFLFRLPG